MAVGCRGAGAAQGICHHVLLVRCVLDVRGEFSYGGKLQLHLWGADQGRVVRNKAVTFKTKIFRTFTFFYGLILFMRPKFWPSGNAACRAENFMSKVGINHTLRKTRNRHLTPLSTAL